MRRSKLNARALFPAVFLMLAIDLIITAFTEKRIFSCSGNDSGDHFKFCADTWNSMAAFAVEPVRAACQMVSCDTGFIDGIQCRMHNYTHWNSLGVRNQCNVFVNAYLWNLFGCIVFISCGAAWRQHWRLVNLILVPFLFSIGLLIAAKSGANAAGRICDCKAVFHVRNYTKAWRAALPFPQFY